MARTSFNSERKFSNFSGFTQRLSKRGKTMARTSFNSELVDETELPKFVVFNSLSNKNYLRPGGKNGYIKFEVEDVERWGVKHEVQKAKYEVGLIHIKCCDTGKYWMWGISEDSIDFITAQADQPCEEITTRACTLIKPSYTTKDGVNVVNLEVMYLGKWWSVGGNSDGYLKVVKDGNFIISNWESLSPNQQHGLSVSDKKIKAAGIGPSLGNEEMALPKFAKEMNLPKFVVLNSLLNKNYLCLKGKNNYMKLKAVDVLSWGVKHEVQMAKSGGGVIHIRCCDTGKYWNFGLSGSANYIVAEANQPGEDIATRACTLIKPSQYTKDGVTVVNLEVMYLGNWWSIGADSRGYLRVGGEDFIISNWELLPCDASTGNEELDLPKFVVFNSLLNKKYLRPGGKNRYMKFEADDVERWGVKHEIQKAMYEAGLVHIRNCDTGKYWTWGLTKDSKEFITAQADQPWEDTTSRACTLIKPSYDTKDGVNVVNLQVMYQGTWWPVSGYNGRYLNSRVVEVDFIISNWESLSPDELQGPSAGDKNIKKGGIAASIGNEEMALPEFEEEMDLPKFVVFNSLLNKNYLCPEGTNSYMKFGAVDSVSWGVKHEVQKAKSGGGLVHIRCCDTGKYWNFGLSGSSSYIVAQASEPGEDRDTRACTLIKPSQYTKDGVRVLNLELMYKGNWFSIGTDGGGCLVDTGGEDFTISNWDLLVGKKRQGSSDGDENSNTRGGASIGNIRIGGGLSVGDPSGNVFIGNHFTYVLGTQKPDQGHKFATPLSVLEHEIGNMNTEGGVSTGEQSY